MTAMAGGDVAGAADGKAALEQAGGELAEQGPQFALGHCAKAFRKKSGAPKLPDFNASSSGF